MMSDAPTTQTGMMTLDEFSHLYDEEGAFEIIAGERKPLMPNVAIHIMTARKLFMLLAAFLLENPIGELFAEAPFVMSDDRQWVRGSRVPDLMFFVAARFAAYKQRVPDWLSKPFVLVPDMVIEIVSPNDRYSDIDERVARYRQDGVRQIWVVDPQRQKVAVHVSESDQQTNLSGDSVLTGGEILPGFEIRVTQIFED